MGQQSLLTPSAAADPSGLTFFTKSEVRVFRTQDGAQSWQAIGVSCAGGFYPNNCNPALTHFFSDSMMDMAVSPTSVNQLAVGEGMACCNRGRVAITMNGGATWVDRPIRGPQWTSSYATSSLAWATPTTLYAGTLILTLTRTVVKSLDGGQTWVSAHKPGVTTSERGGLPLVEVYKLLADSRDTSGNTVYAGTGIGVYRTTDGGASWSRFGANMPMVSVTDLHLSADGTLLRAATYGRGAREIGM
jgi:photosystem II stability/assembly factor-like uncharacterized protein